MDKLSRQLEITDNLRKMERNVTEVRDYSLNGTKAVRKKLQAAENRPILVKETKGGVKITMNTGLYELFKHASATFFCQNNGKISYSNIPVTDKEGRHVEMKYKASDDKTHMYTLNLYHTTCSCLINGRRAVHFLSNDLPTIISSIETALASKNLSVEEINSSLKSALIQLCDKQKVIEIPASDNKTVECTDTGRSSVNNDITDVCDSEQTALKSVAVHSVSRKKTNNQTDQAEIMLETSSMERNNKNCMDREIQTNSAEIGTIAVEHSDISESLKFLKETMTGIKLSLQNHIESTESQFYRLNDEIESLKNHNRLTLQTTENQVESIYNSTSMIKREVSDLTVNIQRKLQSVSEMLKSIQQQGKLHRPSPQQQQQQQQQQFSSETTTQLLRQASPQKQQQRQKQQLSSETTTRPLRQASPQQQQQQQQQQQFNSEKTTRHLPQASPHDGQKQSTTSKQCIADLTRNSPEKDSSLESTVWRTGDVEATQRNQAPISNKTLIFGDSVIKGINKRGLSENVDIHTLPGKKLGDICTRLKKIELNDISNIIIYAGGNDSAINNNLAGLCNELKDTLSIIHSRNSHCNVYICSVCPRRDTNVAALNNMIKRVAQESSIQVIDCYSSFVFGDGRTARHLFHMDGIHLNSSGSRTLVSTINKKIGIIRQRLPNSRNGQSNPRYQQIRNWNRVPYNRGRPQCYNCGMRNHIARDCNRQRAW